MKTNELDTLKSLAECCENGKVERMDFGTTLSIMSNGFPKDSVKINEKYVAHIWNNFLLICEWDNLNMNYLLKIRQ